MAERSVAGEPVHGDERERPDARRSGGREPAAAIVALSALAREASSEGVTAERLLRELGSLAAVTLPVDGVGVSLVEGGALRAVHARPSVLLDVERCLDADHHGPRQEAVAGLSVVAVADAAGAEPWPGPMGARAGMRSVVAVPLVARHRAWGVLTLYRTRVTRWSDQDLVLAGVLADVTAAYLVLAVERERAARVHEHLAHRVTHDELTGLPNRSLLFDRLRHVLLSAPRARTTVAVLFVDIDDFKTTNDTIGHAHGDAVLVEAARRLRLLLRADDMVGRLSGDEFLVICGALNGPTEQVVRRLRGLGRRIRNSLAHSPPDDERGIEVSVSIGGALATDRHTAEWLVDDADRAMYAAKRVGGDCLVVSVPGAVPEVVSGVAGLPVSGAVPAGGAAAGLRPGRTPPGRRRTGPGARS